MSSGEKYLAAAYLVVLLAVLVWVAIISLKLQRFEREMADLAERVRARREQREEAAKPPVRASGPVEGVRGNREVPPAVERGARG